MPPAEELRDTPWLRHVRIKSKLLSDFWGTPVYLGASALLPRDYDKHPDVRYPTIYAQSQEATAPFYFNPDPASQEQELGLKEGNVQTGYEFYQSWIADGFPRFVVIVMEQSSPYFLEAYSVDSANNGPYGQAITQELIPYLEKTFRLIPKSYARIVEGASTGGWEALALQLKYPDLFGGAWVFNPDPIDFHHYLLTNIYEDENAFSVQMSRFMSIERPFRRTVEGQVTHTMRDIARLEAVMGSKGRSGYQLDGWHSVHGPVGPDGYPVPLFDKRTGVIDKKVVEYMRENGYDLTEYTRRNWATLGPKLVGKLNFFSGEMDNFHLNLAVYDFEAMLAQTSNPHYAGRFEYGRPKKGHSWHLTDFAEMIREMAAHVRKSAPPGENTRLELLNAVAENCAPCIVLAGEALRSREGCPRWRRRSAEVWCSYGWRCSVSRAACSQCGMAISEPQVAKFEQINVQRINVVEPDGKPRVILSNRSLFPGLYWGGKEFRHHSRDTGGIAVLQQRRRRGRRPDVRRAPAGRELGRQCRPDVRSVPAGPDPRV